jgi:hypothetical protein
LTKERDRDDFGNVKKRREEEKKKEIREMNTAQKEKGTNLRF